ncbi:MAG: FAD-binding oxidoreductase, partial [Planctomycetales bacterium]|nr:FAD-binding oxidoreductase [Planctomycetales bacterium]
MKPSSHRNVSTIVVGGGVIGLSLAWELSQRGRDVVILEAKTAGKGASWAGAGVLPPTAKQGTSDPYEQLRAMSHELHSQWAKRLHDLTHIDTGYVRCGGIYLASTPAEVATLAANRWWWQEHGIEHQAWTLDELSQHEPALMAGRQGNPLPSGSASDTAPSDIRSVWFLPDEYQ